VTEPRGLRRTVIPTSPLTPEAFVPYGRVLAAQPDATAVTEAEAALDLTEGTPRFYLMDLAGRPPTFTGITRHARVTQCLASVGARPWLLAVAPPGSAQTAETDPALADIVGFRVPGDVAVLLLRGTWHAGPFFSEERMAFFNLELDGTNVEDHETSHLDRRFGVECVFDVSAGPVVSRPR
jgi:ureidoglycolate hydrolase